MENKEIIGRNPVLEYLRTLEATQGAELFISKSAHGKIIDTIIQEARSLGVKTTYCEKNLLARIGPSSRHQGVMLRISGPAEHVRDEDFIAQVRDKKGVLVLLDQLTDPHNIGSIIRSAEALGGDGIVLPRAHSAEVSPTVVKASAGATAHIKIITVGNVANFLEKARGLGFWIIGASAEGDIDPSELPELKPAVIIIGNEGSGMRRLTEEKCDRMVRIPLKGKIASLNASVAAGILLYEILRTD